MRSARTPTSPIALAGAEPASPLKRARLARRLLLGLALLLLAAAPARGEDETPEGKAPLDFDAAKKRYRAWLERPSLYMRHRGRVEFAETGDLRAFEVLAKSYARPEKPKDPVRYLLASLCGEHFRTREAVPIWQAWRARHRKPRDTWLWFRALEAEAHATGPEGVTEVAREHGTALLRAAAREVLIERKDPALLPILAAQLDDPPAKGFERMLLLEGAAEALLALRAHEGTEAFRAVLAKVKAALADDDTSERTKRVIRRRLLRIPDALARPPGPPPARPSFLGIEATGDRIVYVIDMSDSMLKPLTHKEIEDLKRPPHVLRPRRRGTRVITGGKDGKAPRAAAEPTPAEQEEAERIADLPWDDIETRFDAARAFVRLSIRGLSPEQHFCVIGFGSEARPLEATPGLIPAKPRAVEKACRELDAIQPGEATKARPRGTLWGYTNLHGGLHRAFRVGPRGLAKREAYVDPDLFEDGCDTIFLLSDGKPTWDDHPAWDTRLDEHRSGDPESGAEVEDHEKGHYYGPYALASWLRDDLRRLELLRKAEIHCIGIGEHDPHLLRWISERGLGRFRRIPAAR